MALNHLVIYLYLFLMTPMLVHIQPTDALFSWKDVSDFILAKASKLWRNENVKFLGNDCFYTVRPQLRKFKLYTAVNFHCPGLANFTGRAEGKFEAEVFEDSLQDYVQKLLEINIFTRREMERALEKEISEYLKKYRNA